MTLMIKRIGLTLALVMVGPAWAGFTGSTPVIFQKPGSMHAVESRIHLDRQRWDEAIASLTRALHEEPDNVRIGIQLADVHYRLRDYDKSIQLLRHFLPQSSREYNIGYRLALCFDHRHDLRTALGYYFRALQTDPYLLPAYVKIAQIKIRQDLVFDAAKVLRKALEIRADYTPALEELKVVNRLIKSNLHNVYRKGNLVVVFYEFAQVATIEKMWPLMEAHRQNLEDKLGYHIPNIWVKLVPKVERHNGPPVFYDDLEDAIHMSIAALERQDHIVFAHELTWLYLTRMTKKNAPRWLMEGLALVEAHPKFLDETPLRSLDLKWRELDRRLTSEKNYLDFAHNPPEMNLILLRSYLLVRFLLESYGWPTMREMLTAYRLGATQFEKVCLDLLHIPFDNLVARWNMYGITRYYFRPAKDFRF